MFGSHFDRGSVSSARRLPQQLGLLGRELLIGDHALVAQRTTAASRMNPMRATYRIDPPPKTTT
jgi:hypothetical protein